MSSYLVDIITLFLFFVFLFFALGYFHISLDVSQVKYLLMQMTIIFIHFSRYISWINLGALLGTWITLLNSAVISITNLSNPQYFDNDRKLELFGLGEDALVTVDVICVSFLGLRALGFLRGTGIKMATFVLMLQEISWNVSLRLNLSIYLCVLIFL